MWQWLEFQKLPHLCGVFRQICALLLLMIRPHPPLGGCQNYVRPSLITCGWRQALRRRTTGFTLIELLVVLAIIGIVSAISVFNIRNMLRAEQVRGATTALQQMLWQGGSSAAARLEPVVLSFTNNAFVLRAQDSGTVIRREPLPPLVRTNFPTAQTLRFLPVGRIEPASYAAFPTSITVSNTRITYTLSLTILGESRFVVSQ